MPAAAHKPIDDFASLESFIPRAIPIIVGSTRLQMEAPTLAQHSALMSAMKHIDITPLVVAAEPLLVRLLESQQKSEDAFGFVKVLLSEAGKVWSIALDVLGPQMAEGLAEGAAALVDNEANARALIASEAFEAAAIERKSGAYVRCEPLREWVQLSLRGPQALYIVGKAFELGEYANMGKTMMSWLGLSLTQTTEIPTSKGLLGKAAKKK